MFATLITLKSADAGFYHAVKAFIAGLFTIDSAVYTATETQSGFYMLPKPPLAMENSMIKNIPSAPDLENMALRIHFNAWEVIISVIVDKQEIFPGFSDDSEEVKEYIELAQQDLQLAYALMQQSQEIGLKAVLCSTSPFLLLLGSNVRDWARDNGDFSTFRTIDASDLIKAVNAIFPGKLSESYRKQYEEVRGNRNKIQHLGSYSGNLDPYVLMDMMLAQYSQLFSHRKWLPDRLNFQSKTRLSIAYDRKYNEYYKTLGELIYLEELITAKQFKIIYGFPKSKRRYLCPACAYEVSRNFDQEIPQTAIVSESGDFVLCHLCQTKTAVSRTRCNNLECKSNVICADPNWDPECLLCRHDNGRDQNAEDANV